MKYKSNSLNNPVKYITKNQLKKFYTEIKISICAIKLEEFSPSLAMQSTCRRLEIFYTYPHC